MAKTANEVTIRGRFTPGTTVELHERGSADVYAGGKGNEVTKAKTDKNGETTFKAPPGNYFAVATEKEWNHVLGEHEQRTRVVDVTIAEPATAPEPQHIAGPELGPEPPSPSSLGTVGGRIIEGARGTHHLDPSTPTQIVDRQTGVVETFASPVAGQKTPTGELPKHGVPHPRQEDHRGDDLASATLTGEAIPPIVQPEQQEDSGKRQQQASDTELGTQVPPLETVRQEDFKGPQASDTETGVAVPIDEPAQEPPAVPRTDNLEGKPQSSAPRKATRQAKGRGSKAAAKKAVKNQSKANKSRQARAAKKATGSPETQRSKADTTTRSQPAEDVRGVEHREVPEQVGSPEDSGKNK